MWLIVSFIYYNIPDDLLYTLLNNFIEWIFTKCDVYLALLKQTTNVAL